MANVLKKIRTFLRIVLPTKLGILAGKAIFQFDLKTRYKFRRFVVLSSHFGGLGDNLQLSSLPEEFWKQYGKRTYISSGSQHRNQEIFDLVWGCNPYVLGITNAKPNAGDLPAMRASHSEKGVNLISHWEKVHGLTVKNRFPKIYYQPRSIDSFSNVILIDFSSVTLVPTQELNSVNAYNPAALESMLSVELAKWKNREIRIVRFKRELSSAGTVNENREQLEFLKSHQTIWVESIFHYIDLIQSSKAIFTVYSGSAVLSSAVKQNQESPKILTFITKQNFQHELENVNYLFKNIVYIEF